MAVTPEEAATTRALDGLVGVLATRPHPRIRKIITAYVIGQAVYELGKKGHAIYRKRRLYQVCVTGDDEMYGEIQQRIYEMLPNDNRRSLRASAVHTGRPKQTGVITVEEFEENQRKPIVRELRLGYDGETQQKIEIGGHSINVHVHRPQGSSTDDERLREFLLKEEKITFSCYGEDARDAVVEFLKDIADLRIGSERAPAFLMAMRWGSFESRSDLPLRTMDTVIMREGQAERIVTDLETFFASEEYYNKLGLPWHRGILLEGPPGTGKTSIAKAIANHFGMDVYYIPLADLEVDTSLLRLVSQVKPRSMLLFEDIDSAHAATDRTEEDKTVSASGLYNAIDGIATPHGLVIVATTNDVKALDPALIRKGRFDLHERVGYLDAEQFSRLSAMFYGDDLPALPKLRRRTTPNDVIEVFKQHIEDPEGAFTEIRRMKRTKIEE